MKFKSKGTPIIIIGVLFIVGALALTAYNLITEQAAGKSGEDTMEAISAMVSPVPVSETERLPESELPLYKLDPNVSMPEQNVGGIDYIGYLSIPALDLDLPVITETTDYYLTVSPCRFTGSAYLDNLVIGAHNYATHFGKLKNLNYGDEITFTDMDGNLFRYEVADVEILTPDQNEYLCAGDYPLSLYTCTIGGRTRLTVRCAAID